MAALLGPIAISGERTLLRVSLLGVSSVERTGILEGVAAGAGTGAGTLSNVAPDATLSGTAVGAGSAAGVPTVQIGIVGTASGTAVAAGTLGQAAALAGTAAGVGGATGDISQGSVFAGAAAGVGAAIGEIDIEIVPSEIPFTPLMAGPRLWTTATVPSSIKGSGGAAITDGAEVWSWEDQSGNGLHLAPLGATAAAGASANAPLYNDASSLLNSIKPVCFNGTANRLGSATGAISVALTNGGYFIALARLKATGVINYPLCHSGGNFQNILSTDASNNLEAFGVTGDFGTFTSGATPILGALRPNSATATELGLSSTQGVGRLNGAETTGAAATITAPTSARLLVGNRYSGNSGTEMDFFEVMAFQTMPSRGNQQRLEGWIAHTYGIASQLPADHPYKAAAPTVPTGTTSTADWDDISLLNEQQTWIGSYVEGQCDSFDGVGSPGINPPTDGSTDLWGFPYSLTTGSKAAIKADLFPGDGTGYQWFYLPMGFGYRGLRNIDGTSGLAKNIGERFSGQNAAIEDMLDGGIKLAFQYHSPAPHWKQSSTFGNTTTHRGLWAGGANARSVRLGTIKGSDLTGYNAQIDAFTDAVIDDMIYVHQNIAPIGMFSLANEPFNTAAAGYGHCEYTQVEYDDIFASLVPKIDAHPDLPDDILIHLDSWACQLTSSTWAVANPTRIFAGTVHHIVDLYTDGDFIKNNVATWKSAANIGGAVKPIWDNEFEYFDTSLQTDEWRCANNMLIWAHFHRLLNAPAHCHILHFCKQLGSTGISSNTKGYALYEARLPAPWGDDPATPGDPYPSLDHGEAQTIPHNWHSANLVLKNLPVGAVRLAMSKTTFPTGTQASCAVGTDGKLRVFLVNRSASAVDFKIGIGPAKSMSGKSYRVDQNGVAITGVNASALLRSVPAYTGEVWTEQ